MLITCQIHYVWSCLINIREKPIHNHFATFQHLFYTKLTTSYTLWVLKSCTTLWHPHVKYLHQSSQVRKEQMKLQFGYEYLFDRFIFLLHQLSVKVHVENQHPLSWVVATNTENLPMHHSLVYYLEYYYPFSTVGQKLWEFYFEICIRVCFMFGYQPQIIHGFPTIPF